MASPTNGFGFESHWLPSVCACVRVCVCVLLLLLLLLCYSMNNFNRCFSKFLCFIFYFILILFNLLAKAVLQYDPNHITEIQKQHILMGNGVKY